MAASVTRLELRTRIRFEADMVSSTRATDADINTLINTHKAELYDRLVEAGPPDYYASTSTVTTIAGTIAYALPADFRSLLGVFYNETSTRKREILEMQPGTMAAFDAPVAVCSLTLKYVPTATLFTADGDALDGVSGWDELVVLLCARALRARDNRDTSSFDARISEQRQRVLGAAPKRNRSGPRYVNDVEAADAWPCVFTAQNIDAWELSGGYLNLYTFAAVWP